MLSARTNPERVSARTRPYCSIAPKAFRCATRSSKPSSFCAARTSSAHCPPPGTSTTLPAPAVAMTSSQRGNSPELARLPPSLTIHSATLPVLGLFQDQAFYRCQRFAWLISPTICEVGIVKIFPERLVLFQIDQYCLLATFAVDQKFDTGHVHEAPRCMGQSGKYSPRSPRTGRPGGATCYYFRLRIRACARTATATAGAQLDAQAATSGTVSTRPSKSR